MMARRVEPWASSHFVQRKQRVLVTILFLRKSWLNGCWSPNLLFQNVFISFQIEGFAQPEMQVSLQGSLRGCMSICSDTTQYYQPIFN